MKTLFKSKFILLVVLILSFVLITGCSQSDSAKDETDVPTSAGQGAELTATPVPSPTFTPTPVMTPTPTPEADPRVELGNPVWGAVFEDGTQTWFQYDHSNGKAEVRDNMLVLTSYKANSYDNWSMSYQLMTDFYLELRFTTGPECSG